MVEQKLNRMERMFKLEAITPEGDTLYIISDSPDRTVRAFKVLSGNKYESVKMYCGASEVTLAYVESLKRP